VRNTAQADGRSEPCLLLVLCFFPGPRFGLCLKKDSIIGFMAAVGEGAGPLLSFFLDRLFFFSNIVRPTDALMPAAMRNLFFFPFLQIPPFQAYLCAAAAWRISRPSAVRFFPFSASAASCAIILYPYDFSSPVGVFKKVNFHADCVLRFGSFRLSKSLNSDRLDLPTLRCEFFMEYPTFSSFPSAPASYPAYSRDTGWKIDPTPVLRLPSPLLS